jgi:hypothetical protein
MIKKILEKITSKRVRLRDLLINNYKDFLLLGFYFQSLLFLLYLLLSGDYRNLFTADFWAISNPVLNLTLLAIYFFMVLFYAITIVLQIYFLTTAFWLSKKYGRFCFVLLIGIYLSVLFHLIPEYFQNYSTIGKLGEVSSSIYTMLGASPAYVSLISIVQGLLVFIFNDQDKK